MKKIASLYVVVTVAISYFSIASIAYAAPNICPTGPFASLCNISLGSNTIGKVLTTMLVVGAILSLFFLIWGGIRWIMSSGDKAKLDAARGTITAAIVGLIIAFLAFAIVAVITFIFTGNSITTFTIPTLVGP